MRLAPLLLLALLVGCKDDPPSSRAVPTHEAPSLLIDRNWLDHYPEHRDDRLRVVRFVPQMGGGVFQDRTMFAGNFELFGFGTKDDMIELHLPHSGDNLIVHYKIEKVEHGPFDLRLTLERNPRGPRVYYSVSDQHGATTAELDAQLAQLPAR